MGWLWTRGQIPTNATLIWWAGGRFHDVGQLLPRVYQFLTASWPQRLLLLPSPEPMAADAQQQKRRDIALSSLNAAIETLNLAKEISSITPAKAVFGSVSVILTTIKVCFLPRHLCWSIAN